MPIVRMNVGECPDDGTPIQSGVNLWILADIGRVVIIHKPIAKGWAENRERNRHYRKTDRKI